MSKLQQLFLSRVNGKKKPATAVDRVVIGINQSIAQQGGAFADQRAVSSFISTESISDPMVESALRDAGESLNLAISDILSTEDFSSIYDNAADARVLNNMKTAAMYGGMIGQAPQEYMNFKPGVPSLESNEIFIDNSGKGSFLAERISVSTEAYDERDNRHATAYSIAYNLLAARQDEFGEAFFPTIIVPPNEVGIVVSIRLINVMEDIRRDVSGSLDKFKKRNIIHAIIDSTILRNDATTIVPVYSTETENNFVPGLAPVEVVVDGETVETSALAFGKRFSLLGISQTAKLLQSGMMDITDSVDSAIKLKSIVFELADNTDPANPGNEFVEVRTSVIPLCEFHSAQQGHYRTMRLAFDPQTLVISGNLLKADGTGVSSVLAPIAAQKLSVHLSISVNGSVNQETGETSLTSSEIAVVAVYDEDNQELSLTSGPGKVAADLFVDAKAVGYKLTARRTNSNRLQRGQLLTTDFYRQIYNVPVHAPLTTLRPVTASDQTDASDLATLVTATHVVTSNAAVTRILEFIDEIRDYRQNSRIIEQNPQMLGIANWLVQAFFYEETLDVAEIVDSLRSADRMADLQAALVSTIRHWAFKAVRDSGYEVAAAAQNGGIVPKTTVIVGTDPIIAQYLMITGDHRTLGPNYDMKVVVSQDLRMRGRMLLSLGQFGEGKEGQPNPMHFGFMPWKSEVPLVLPMTRNGRISKELTVHPSFTHCVNLPIMVSFTVTNIEKVIEEKVTINTSN